MRTVLAVVLALGALGLGHPEVTTAQGPDTGREPPDFIIGDFIDDYGIRYTISREFWSQGRETYEIIDWDSQNRRILARNGPDNASDAGLWTRIDWVVLEATSAEYQWAFCYAVYDAPSADSAASVPRSGTETPRTGCNTFPFSRMKRVR